MLLLVTKEAMLCRSVSASNFNTKAWTFLALIFSSHQQMEWDVWAKERDHPAMWCWCKSIALWSSLINALLTQLRWVEPMEYVKLNKPSCAPQCELSNLECFCCPWKWRKNYPCICLAKNYLRINQHKPGRVKTLRQTPGQNVFFSEGSDGVRPCVRGCQAFVTYEALSLETFGRVNAVVCPSGLLCSRQERAACVPWELPIITALLSFQA